MFEEMEWNCRVSWLIAKNNLSLFGSLLQESYVEIEKAIRSLAGFYSKAGPSAPLPEQVKSEILNDLNTAEEFLWRHSLFGASEIDIASSLMYNWVIYGGSLEGMLAYV